MGETPYFNRCVMAMTGPAVDLCIKRQLGEAWKGRGVAILVNVAEAEDFFWCTASELTLIANVIFHEVGHAVADLWGPLSNAEPDDIGPEDLHMVESVCTAVTATDWFADAETAGESVPEFLQHGPRWLRTCCHFAHRLGVSAFAVFGRRDNLSDPERYSEALADEPERCVGQPLAEILATPLPEAFARLWEEDYARFLKQRALAALTLAELNKKENPMSFLEELKSVLTGRFRAKAKTSLEKFHALAKKIAAGQKPSADEAEAILEDAQKSTDDLVAEVSKLERRRQLQQTVARADGVAAERAELDQRRAALQEPLDKAQADLASEMPGIWARYKELETLERQAEQAKARLADECADESLLAEIAKLDTEYAELRSVQDADGQLRGHLAGEAQKKEYEADRENRRNWTNESFEAMAAKAKEASAGERQQADQIDLKMRAADKRMLAIQKEKQAVRDRMSLSPV
jgi:hypothetical protein